MKKKILLCCLFVSTNALADTSVVSLPEIVTTASRIDETVDSVSQNSQVINRTEIEKRSVRFVLDLLSQQSDLNINQSGSFGTNASIMLRGSSSGQLLVMIDGVKQNSPSSGSTDISNLLTTDVEKIEIIKGPQSTIYGSEAMAGVINIITKKGGDKLKADLSAEGGTFNTFKFAGTVAGGALRYNYRISGTYFDTDGFPIAKAGSVANGNTNKSVSAKLNLNPTDNSAIELALRYLTSKVSLDHYGFSGPIDTKDFIQNIDNYQVSLLGRVFLTEKYEQNLTLAFTRDNFLSRDPDRAYPWNNSDIKSATESLNWQHNLDLNRLTLTGGFSYRHDASNSKGAFDNSSDDKAGYINSKFTFFADSLIFNAGIRYDNYSTFGDAITYRMGGMYYLKAAELRFRANLGSGFRAPVLNELYYPGYGNPNLKPEKNSGFDFGVEKDFFDKKLLFTATYFCQNYKNLIQSDPNSWTAQNIGHAKIDGVELLATATVLKHFKILVGYTYLNAINRDTGAFLSLRPKNKLTSTIEYGTDKLLLTAEYKYVSGRYDSSVDRDLSAYSLVNLKGSYQILENLSAFARINNIFNQPYEESGGYGTAGISVFGGLKVYY